MKIGMPSLIEFNTVEENILLCKKLGFNFIELNMNFPYNMIESLDCEYIKNITKSENISFTMHMPDDADIGSFYSYIRDGYINLFIDTIKWCNKAGVGLINMHIPKGAYMTLTDKKIYINEKYSARYISSFLSSLKVISDIAAKNNVIVCIENSSNFNLDYVQQILNEALALESIRLTWDTGHDYVSSYLDKKILLKHKDKISHMHLHDANNISDHLILGSGEIDINERIAFARSNNVTMLVEVKSSLALEKSRIYLKNNNSL